MEPVRLSEIRQRTYQWKAVITDERELEGGVRWIPCEIFEDGVSFTR
jgi:hypothetical protein